MMSDLSKNKSAARIPLADIDTVPANQSVLHDPKKRKKIEKQQAANDALIYEFLPAAIEVENTPASPAGLAIIWAIALLFVIAVVWAFFGEIDIVAVATGKIIPSEHIKQIQPLDAGKIIEIHVREGQEVKQGDALITLDATQSQANVRQLSYELAERIAISERLIAVDSWLSHGSLLLSDTPTAAILGNLSSTQQNLLDQQKAELRARIRTLNSEKAKQRAEQAMTQAEITKKRRVLPVLSERVEAFASLVKKEYGSKLQYLEIKQQLIEEEQDLIVQQARLQQLDAAIQSTQNQIDTLIFEQRKNNLGQLQETQLKIAGLEQELIKAEQRVRQQKIIAPISGQVQQLAVHTIGGVVTPAQPLMVIVPEESQMEVEAMILNRDIGFIHEGQKAEVKIDTFNFTKFGLIDAEIRSISNDAIQDENFGLVYSIRIQLMEETIDRIFFVTVVAV
ncbi:MAG: HlyD family type I secretion periplasmic adaptor subunit [Pseudomonadales bacterium]|nr:HlyD family type I secretion periplasmic adaptor subunit [Pseudomonadales bacterium]